MAFAAKSLHILRGLQCSPTEKPFFVGHPTSIRTNLILPHHPFSPSSVTFARRPHTPANSPPGTSKKQKKKQISHRKGAQEDEDLDEDGFEALFRQLEEDLKNDNQSLDDDDDDDDDISEEDLAKLEQELEEALKDDELLAALGPVADGETKDESEDEEERKEGDGHQNFRDDHDVEEEDDEEENRVKLKNWQFKRLAYALKNGRRKTNIKNLAADLCLDRAVVLELLRDPPPNLLMMSAALPDKPVSTIVEPVQEPTETETETETIPKETTTGTTKADANVKVPVHVMQSNWSAQKRLKKVQLETLERVYRRTKRPTNAMISSIVHVTNLPHKRVVKWFEDKRAEDEVPDRRLPYQRSTAHTC